MRLSRIASATAAATLALFMALRDTGARHGRAATAATSRCGANIHGERNRPGGFRILRNDDEAVAKAVEQVFSDQGQPDAYIKGDEGSGAFVVGLRYGSGWLIRKDAQPLKCLLAGPSVGFDFGGNASKFFTLVYNLAAQRPAVPALSRRGRQLLFRRGPRRELSARGRSRWRRCARAWACARA